MVKRQRQDDDQARRASEDEAPQLDRRGGLAPEELTPERGGEVGGGRDVERHDRTRDREVDEPTV